MAYSRTGNFARHEIIEYRQQGFDGCKSFSGLRFFSIKMSFGIQEVSIHQARKHHAHPQRKAWCAAGYFFHVRNRIKVSGT